MIVESYARLAVFLLCAFALSASITGCSYYSGSGRMKEFSLVKPARSVKPVYEDKDFKAVFRIIDDKVIELHIKNRADKVLRVFWTNSTFAAIDDPEAEIGFRHAAGMFGSPEPVQGGTSVIEAGGSLTFETYPAYSEFINDEGTPDNRPLYAGRNAEGNVEDLAGKPIGLNLLMEINGNTRLFRFRLDVTPSPPGKQ